MVNHINNNPNGFDIQYLINWKLFIDLFMDTRIY